MEGRPGEDHPAGPDDPVVDHGDLAVVEPDAGVGGLDHRTFGSALRASRYVGHPRATFAFPSPVT